MFLDPRQKRARKRHRGGGGVAVPGPFKRIARAGGQKVTIRTAQRALLEISSDVAPSFSNFFQRHPNERCFNAKLLEKLVDRHCIGRVYGPRWTAIASL